MINEWLNTLRSTSTRKVYIAGVKDFADLVLKTKDNLDEAFQPYLKTKKEQIFKDLQTYASSLVEKPPMTANAYIAGVMSFLEYAVDLELSRKQRKQLKNRMPKGKRARTIEEELSKDKLKQILTHCDAKGTALFLFLESSGIRVGEALQLEIDDLNQENSITKVIVRGEYTKTGDKYFSFISREAKDALAEWLRIRGEYIITASKRGSGLAKTGFGRGEKKLEDKRIFPFTFSVADSMWKTALKKAGLENHDKGTGRHTLHIHILRKYFISHMKAAGVPDDLVEGLVGHEEGLDSAYRRYGEQQIKEWYEKGEAALYVFAPQNLSEMQTDINKLEKQNLRLMLERDDSRSEIEKLKQKFKDFEEWRAKLDLQLNTTDLIRDKQDEEAYQEFMERLRRKHEVKDQEAQQKEDAERLEQLKKEGFGKAERKKTAVN